MKKLLVAAVAVAASVASFSAVAQTQAQVAAVTAAQAHEVFATAASAKVTADKVNLIVSQVAPTVVKAKVTADMVTKVISLKKDAAKLTAYINAQKAFFGLEAKRDIKTAEVERIVSFCQGTDDHACAQAFNAVTGAAS